jgi:sugar O-acyltransferase (sialic acid O-acetyltransferase NeuD family)
MSRRIVIIGCGGFGREVVSIVHARRSAGEDIAVDGVVDDSPSPGDLRALERLGVTYLGGTEAAAALGVGLELVVAVGNPQARRALVARLGEEVSYATLVHPDSTLGAAVQLGTGCVIAPGARLSTQITLGSHVHVDQNATVGHDTVIGDFVRLNPQACVSGSVRLGDGALVGASATVIQGLDVGEGCVIGAGAVVTRDVLPHTTVKGVPAR